MTDSASAYLRFVRCLAWHRRWTVRAFDPGLYVAAAVRVNTLRGRWTVCGHGLTVDDAARDCLARLVVGERTTWLRVLGVVASSARWVVDLNPVGTRWTGAVTTRKGRTVALCDRQYGTPGDVALVLLDEVAVRCRSRAATGLLDRQLEFVDAGNIAAGDVVWIDPSNVAPDTSSGAVRVVSLSKGSARMENPDSPQAWDLQTALSLIQGVNDAELTEGFARKDRDAALQSRDAAQAVLTEKETELAGLVANRVAAVAAVLDYLGQFASGDAVAATLRAKLEGST